MALGGAASGLNAGRQWPCGWGPVVSSYAIGDGDRLLLFDPLAPPSEIDELAAGRETAIC